MFISGERGRTLRQAALPDDLAVSVVTVAELALGVHMARSDDEREARLTTYRGVTAQFVPVPIDDRVAETFARLVAEWRRAGRRPRVQDSWIAATAVAHGAAVVTQDAGFDDLSGLEVIRV